MATQRVIAPGDTIAGYAIERLVARGGMGEVYLAHDPRLGRPVALKLLAERLAGDATFRERLLRESRLAAGLDHPNVVPVYEAGEHDGHLFIAMRYVDGDLRRLLREVGQLEPARALAIAEQVADALDAAHAQGLVHRDVKPSNVLLDTQGGREHVYLADFGLTQSASDTGPTDGSLMGTVDYVAPEQIRGDELDGRADVYSLGCLLFEALTGRRPFVGSSDVAIVYSHLDGDVPRASAVRAGLPPELDDVLARAMAKAPGDRPASCRALIEETRAALGLDRGTQRRARWLLPLAVALFAAVVAGALAVRTMADATPPGRIGRIVGIDPTSGAVTSMHTVTSDPGAVTTGGGRVWAADFRDGSLWRLNPTTGDLARFTTLGEPRDISALGEAVYVASDGETLFDGNVTRYDAVTGNREDSVDVLACAVAAGLGTVWASGCPYVNRISTGPGRLRVTHATLVPFQQPRSSETNRNALRDMAIGEGALWVVGDPVDRRVFKIEARTGQILATIRLRFAPRSIAVGEGGVWVTGLINDLLARIDPATARVTGTTPVPAGASGVAAGFGAVWVASALDGSVSRVAPGSLAVEETVDVPGSPREIATGADGVWVTTVER